ncbi:MAG: acyl-CoA dehydrogenase protein [Frankiales bacterium]|nr:acyl-CoA dehydrogenase protein [Frankiales bacterium]
MIAARIRTLAEAGGGLDGAGTAVPLAAGASLAEAVLVADRLGRELAPEPFVETNVVATVLRRDGSPRQRAEVLPAVVDGRRTVTWTHGDLPGWWGTGPGLDLRPGPGGFLLRGTATSVQQAGDADLILVGARDGQGVTQVLVPRDAPGVRLTRLQALDLTRARYAVTFDGVRVSDADLVGARRTADLDRQVTEAVVLAVAQTVGSMTAVFEVAVAHAKSRVAFGRPIGSFQAVKHLLVDAGLGLEMSRAMCAAAVAAVDDGQADASEVVSMAKSFVARSGIELAHASWQVLGGIAYMWENDFHLYLRRITADAALFGTSRWHHERICRLHALGET